MTYDMILNEIKIGRDTNFIRDENGKRKINKKTVAGIHVSRKNGFELIIPKSVAKNKRVIYDNTSYGSYEDMKADHVSANKFYNNINKNSDFKYLEADTDKRTKWRGRGSKSNNQKPPENQPKPNNQKPPETKEEAKQQGAVEAAKNLDSTKTKQSDKNVDVKDVKVEQNKPSKKWGRIAGRTAATAGIAGGGTAIAISASKLSKAKKDFKAGKISKEEYEKIKKHCKAAIIGGSLAAAGGTAGHISMSVKSKKSLKEDIDFFNYLVSLDEAYYDGYYNSNSILQNVYNEILDYLQI